MSIKGDSPFGFAFHYSLIDLIFCLCVKGSKWSGLHKQRMLVWPEGLQLLYMYILCIVHFSSLVWWFVVFFFFHCVKSCHSWMLNLKQDTVRPPVPWTDHPVQEFPAMERRTYLLPFSLTLASVPALPASWWSFLSLSILTCEKKWAAGLVFWKRVLNQPLERSYGPWCWRKQPAGEGKSEEMSTEERNTQLIRPLSPPQLT